MDEYPISNIPQRFLMTQHYQSSMDEPNLDNVEAKLTVARHRNHQLALQYFKSKYGSTAMYESFAKSHNLGEPLRNLQLSSEQVLLKHLQTKAREIQKNFYHQQDHEQNQSNQRMPQWAKKQKKGSAANNPWIRGRVDGNKQQQENKQKYVDSIKLPMDKQSEFLSQFKNYLINKDRNKQLNIESKTGNKNESTTNFNQTSQSKVYSPSKLGKSLRDEQTNAGQKKKLYQEELSKRIFKDITGSNKDDAKVEKLALVQYAVRNKKILKVLGFTEADFSRMIIKDYKTNSENEITQNEFTIFILRALGKEKQVNQLKQQKRSKDIPEGCMLDRQIILHFEKTFKHLDIHTDLIVKRLKYIERLANDPIVRNVLNAPAVYQPAMEQSINLRRIFQRIQVQCIYGSEEQQKVKQYISWNEFLDYFKAGFSSDSTYNMVALIDSLRKSDTMGLVEIPDGVIKIISETAAKMTVQSGSINTLQFIDSIRKHPQFDDQKYTEVRQQSRMSGLPSQTFEQVLVRLKKKGKKFMNIKQFLEYFSARGKPIQDFQQSKNKQAKKNFSGVKVTFAQKQIMNQNQELDGYDSDPEMYQSKLGNKNSGRRSGRSATKLEQATSFLEQSKDNIIINKDFKVTIPIPFSFEQRQRQRSKQKNNSSSINEADNYQFRAKPMPQKVMEIGLFQKMKQDDRKKIQQRKKACMIMTLANQRPFSFLDRKVNKKNKQQREQYIFKAKPIPWYCSVDLLQKKKEAEIVRNEKIAKEAQQNLAKAKLPPRMERDYQQRQAKLSQNEYQKGKNSESKPKIYREPPNFDRIHRQFEQAMERKRKQNKTTKPQEFNLTQNNGPRNRNKDEGENLMYETKKSFVDGKDYKKIFESKPAAASTAKFDQLVQKRRIQMEKKRKQQQDRKVQEENRKKIDDQLKNKLMNATKNKQNKEKQQKQKREQQMRKQNQDFKNWKKQRIQKGRNQPMLIQRPLKRDQKIEKMKKLYQISQTLKSNGIKGKDHDAHFKKQQLIMLQDWQSLKDKL